MASGSGTHYALIGIGWRGRDGRMDKRTRLHLWYAFVAVWLVILIQGWWQTARETETIPYSEFLSYVRDGKIGDVTISDQAVRGSFKDPIDGKTRFVSARVDPALAQELASSGVRFEGVVENTFLTTILSWVVPILIFFAIWVLVFRRFAERQGLGGLMSVGRSRAKIYVETDTKTRFADVAGVDEAKDELMEVVDFLKNPKEYGSSARGSRRACCWSGRPAPARPCWPGPWPARRACRSSRSPARSSSRCSWAWAPRACATCSSRRARPSPAIIFIDELDALGRARGAFGQAGGHDEREQTLNQLLTELDGFDPSEGVVLLAATNRPEILDPALLRAGRFDRQVLVDRPDRGAASRSSRCTRRRSSSRPTSTWSRWRL